MDFSYFFRAVSGDYGKPCKKLTSRITREPVVFSEIRENRSIWHRKTEDNRIYMALEFALGLFNENRVCHRDMLKVG